MGLHFPRPSYIYICHSSYVFGVVYINTLILLFLFHLCFIVCYCCYCVLFLLLFVVPVCSIEILWNKCQYLWQWQWQWSSARLLWRPSRWQPDTFAIKKKKTNVYVFVWQRFESMSTGIVRGIIDEMTQVIIYMEYNKNPSLLAWSVVNNMVFLIIINRFNIYIYIYIFRFLFENKTYL